MKLIALPAFSNNDIWMFHDGHQAIDVDPGDAAPVPTALAASHLTLAAILGGCLALGQSRAVVSCGARLGADEVCGSATQGVGNDAGCRKSSRAFGLRLQRGPGPEPDNLPVTHRRAEHAGSIDTLRPHLHGPVDGLKRECIPQPCVPLIDGERIEVLGLHFEVLAEPGYTSRQIACCAHEHPRPNLRFARRAAADEHAAVLAAWR